MNATPAPRPTFQASSPEDVAHLLDVVAEHDLDHALANLERMLDRLRTNAAIAAEAKDTLRSTPAEVLREALRLRAARNEVRR